MKKIMTHLTIVAAALAAAAGSAAAQTYKADIPVAFRAGDKVMAPGKYEISVNNSGINTLVRLRNTVTSDSAVLLPFGGHDAPKAWRKAGTPMVGLSCGRTCTMKELYTARDITSLQFAAPKLPKAEVDRAATEMTFTLVKSE